MPPAFLAALEAAFELKAARADPDRRTRRIFDWSRVTGWRTVKAVCAVAWIEGLAAAPKGMRHGFGVGTLQSGVPIPLTQKWLGHAKPSTTVIYQQCVGDEERGFAQKFWNWTEREAA